MRFQPNRDYVSNDDVMTPKSLCDILYYHLSPNGVILEPCRGSGNFYSFFPEGSPWCEIKEGKDFFDYNEKVDWIITNPPWSLIGKFLVHSMEIADHVCFVATINHLWTKARIRNIKNNGFGIKEIILFDQPKNFPQSGFQLGMFHLERRYKGSTSIWDLEYDGN